MSADRRLLDRLPPACQDELAALGRASRTLLGKPRRVQEVVDQHLDVFERLISGGLSYKEIALLLHEVGLGRPDGGPLPESTLSSAVSRSRAHGPAVDRRELRAPAGGGTAPQGDAGARSVVRSAAETRGDPPVADAPWGPAPDRAREPAGRRRPLRIFPTRGIPRRRAAPPGAPRSADPNRTGRIAPATDRRRPTTPTRKARRPDATPTRSRPNAPRTPSPDFLFSENVTNDPQRQTQDRHLAPATAVHRGHR